MQVPVNPPSADEIMTDLIKKDQAQALRLYTTSTLVDSRDRYLHWDKLRFLDPPEGLSNENWWAGMKWARRAVYKHLPFRDATGTDFKFAMLDAFQRELHWLDQHAAGTLTASHPILSVEMKNTYLISSLQEEAITSSQLEGASTTRDVAKQMLREQRKPRDRSELMIFNNYRAMNFVKRNAKERLTIRMVNEIHRILTVGTLDKQSKAGTFRDENDDIHVVAESREIVYTPPVASGLETWMRQLCEFANDFDGFFVHPVVRAIILHFMLSYIHPYVDGNGRTARALFYWSMLRDGYWLVEFVSISRILQSAPAKYGRAFLYAETDENDLTYFIVHQLDVVRRSISELQQYIQKRVSGLEELEKQLKHSNLTHELNHRQLALLRHGMSHSGHIYTIQQHKNTHGVAYDTARKDLSELSDRWGLLMRVKRGRSFLYVAPSDLQQRLLEKAQTR